MYIKLFAPYKGHINWTAFTYSNHSVQFVKGVHVGMIRTVFGPKLYENSKMDIGLTHVYTQKRKGKIIDVYKFVTFKCYSMHALVRNVMKIITNFDICTVLVHFC